MKVPPLKKVLAVPPKYILLARYCLLSLLLYTERQNYSKILHAL